MRGLYRIPNIDLVENIVCTILSAYCVFLFWKIKKLETPWFSLVERQIE